VDEFGRAGTFRVYREVGENLQAGAAPQADRLTRDGELAAADQFQAAGRAGVWCAYMGSAGWTVADPGGGGRWGSGLLYEIDQVAGRLLVEYADASRCSSLRIDDCSIGGDMPSGCRGSGSIEGEDRYLLYSGI
jgi:hypothetical protein